MQYSESFSLSETGINKTVISIPSIVLYVALVLVIGLGPLLPEIVTQPIRPLVILICFLIPGRYSYRANNTIWVFGIYLFYMTIVFLCHDLTHDTFMAWVSAVLFGAFFIVVSQRMWSTKEVRTVIVVVFLATLLYTSIVHYYNRDLFHEAAQLEIRGSHVNTNAAAYNISSGALCGVSLYLFYNNKHKHLAWFKLLVLFGTLFIYYTLLCLGQRSGFFASVLGALLILWERTGRGKNKSTRNTMRLLIILFVVVGLIAGPRVTEGTHAERLFDYEHIFDDNGRDELNDIAKDLIAQKPVFGGGFDYWETDSGQTLGLHNGFLQILVIGGYCAGILISFFFVYLIVDIWRNRSAISLAFIILAAAHMFTDSGLDYYSYIPMILAYILTRNATFRGTRVSDILTAH